LKSRTKSEKEKAAQRKVQLDEMEDLLKDEQVTIGVLDQKAQKHLKETMEAHDEVDARVDDCAKLQADLERLVSDVS
jgi:hypothetical protein